MSEQPPVSQKRQLRQSTEGKRERVDRPTADNGQRTLRARLRHSRAQISRFGIWRPFKFIVRYTIPPYLRRSWQELRHVTWPNRKQTRQLVMAVLLFSIVFGIIVAITDYGLDKLFKQVIVR